MSLPKSLREEQKEAKEAYLKERDAKKDTEKIKPVRSARSKESKEK